MSDQPNHNLTKKMRFALCVAAQRPRRTVCPVKTGNGKVNAAAEDAMLGALYRRGLIEYDGCIPVISDAGMLVVDETLQQSAE